MKKLIAACALIACTGVYADSTSTLPASQEARDALWIKGTTWCLKVKQNPNVVPGKGTEEEVWRDLCKWYNSATLGRPDWSMMKTASRK